MSIEASPRSTGNVARTGSVCATALSPVRSASSPSVRLGMSSETGVASGSESTTLRLTATGLAVSTWISDAFSASDPAERGDDRSGEAQRNLRVRLRDRTSAAAPCAGTGTDRPPRRRSGAPRSAGADGSRSRRPSRRRSRSSCPAATRAPSFSPGAYDVPATHEPRLSFFIVRSLLRWMYRYVVPLSP